MSDESPVRLSSAISDFRYARRRAAMEQVIARLRGKTADLLSYEEVREKLRATESAKQELRDIPLDAIVGSVGRYADFTRRFLPRKDSDEGRWARVKLAVTDLRGVPPIEVYQVGEAYFVRDGNHRVSIARELDASHIQAYVTPVESKVPLSAEDQPDDLILKAEYTDFLEYTQLQELRPGSDLTVTVPGQYPLLEEHIQVHWYFMGLDLEREIPYDEAVVHWYDEVYLPIVEAIRERGILRDFPGRTEADLYLWVSEHRAELEQEMGWYVKPEAAADDFAAQFSSTPSRIVERLLEKVVDIVVPDELEAGPAVGEWREKFRDTDLERTLFTDILVALSGEEDSWAALEQALVIAQQEGAQVHGLHVVPSEDQVWSDSARSVRLEFERRCEVAGISGEMRVEAGEIPRRICERSRFVDLFVLNLAYPPAAKPLAKLGSGFRTILRGCPRPVLAVPGKVGSLKHPLLAYDGSSKAKEALFLAAYIAGKWGTTLTVATVSEVDTSPSEVITWARDYLEGHGVRAAYIEEKGRVAQTLLDIAETHQNDVLLMGGYGFAPVFEVVLGSVVDEVLRESQKPVLICR
jgi:nucleotide-binding universal stress UspA family protein